MANTSGDGSGMMEGPSTQIQPITNCPEITAGQDLGIRYGLNCGLSVLIVIILVFLQRRRRRNANCLWGFIGVPIPMDFLITPQHRWIYISLFPLMATNLLAVYFNTSRPPVDHYVFGLFWNTLFYPAIVVFALALEYVALFACADASIPIIGHALGLFYSIVWYGSLVLGFRVVQYIRYGPSCMEIAGESASSIAFSVLLDAPILLLGLFVLLWYIFYMIFDIVELVKSVQRSNKWHNYYPLTQQPYQKNYDNNNIFLTGAHYYHFQHVKRLLSPQQKKIDELKAARGKIVSLLIKMLKLVFPWPFQFKRNFRFPVPYLGAVAAMIMILWRLTFTVSFFAFLIIDRLSIPFNEQFVPLIQGGLLTSLTGFNFSQEIIDVFVDSGRLVIVGIPVSAILSMFVSMLFCVYMVAHMMGAVSKHINKVAKRGFKAKKLTSPVSRVPAAWKYTGIQIGFFVYAWIIYAVILFLVGIVVGVVYLLIKYQTSWFFRLVLGAAIPAVWSKLVLWAQFILCKFIFIDEAAGKFVNITNQRLFNWLAFLLFFYNAIFGFIAAILRALISIVFGALLLFRLDRVVLMTGFEFMDFGHRAYIGFLYLNYNYNNAVMHVFSSLAQQAIHSQSKKSLGNTDASTVTLQKAAYENEDPLPLKNPVELELKGSQSTACRSRNRWLVAYTLIKNPSLKKLRYKNLLEAAKKFDEQGHESEFVANIAAIRGKKVKDTSGLDIEPTQI